MTIRSVIFFELLSNTDVSVDAVDLKFLTIVMISFSSLLIDPESIAQLKKISVPTENRSSAVNGVGFKTFGVPHMHLPYLLAIFERYNDDMSS